MFFYTDVFGISAAAVGTMFLITRLWDTANDPMMGLIADRTRSRHGKFRPWLMWGLPALMISSILTFTTPDLGTTGKIIWAYATYTAAGMAYTAVNVPYSALMGVMSAHSEERTILASFRFFGAYAGSMIVQQTMLWLVANLGQGSEQLGYQLTMVVYSLLAAGLFYFTFAGTKERVSPPPTERRSLRQDLTDLITNGPWVALCTIAVLTLVGISIRNGAILYYFKYYMGNQALASAFLVTGTVVSFVGVAGTKYVTRLFGEKRRAFMVLCLLNGLLTAAFYFVQPTDRTLLFTLQVVASLAAAPMMPLTWAMFADTADYAEYRNNRRTTGLIFSAGTASQKFGWTIGGAIAGWLLEWYGFQANVDQAPTTLNGIVLLMSVVPGAILVFTAACTFIYRIDRKMEQELRAAVVQHAAERNRATT
jgi:GPH family glycoside/pentoside/hexuronide:cation symporter